MILKKNCKIKTNARWMAVFFVFFFLLPDFLSAQDCALKKETDEFTGKPKLTTDFFELKGAKLTIDATASGFDYFFVVKNPASNCFDENSEVAILFDGEKNPQEVRNAGSTNCDGIFHIVFRGAKYTPGMVKKLSAKKVNSFIFSDRNAKKTVINLTEEQQKLFMKFSGCIAEEAKTL